MQTEEKTGIGTNTDKIRALAEEIKTTVLPELLLASECLGRCWDGEAALIYTDILGDISYNIEKGCNGVCVLCDDMDADRNGDE